MTAMRPDQSAVPEAVGVDPMTRKSMKGHPILFSAAMVRAILEGEKTQTRRIARLNASGRVAWKGHNWHCDDPESRLACPYGQPGDRLWVRETWADTMSDPPEAVYRADGERHPSSFLKWKPSIFMPRWASRITLEVTGVRVERLQEISKADVIAEGIDGLSDIHAGWHQPYAQLWDSINAKRAPWSSNPLVWVIEFKRVQ